MEIDVTAGHDGYLFLRHGSNEALRFCPEPDDFSDTLAHAWAERLIARWDYFVGEGVRATSAQLAHSMEQCMFSTKKSSLID